MNSRAKNLIFWLVIILVFLVLFQILSKPPKYQEEIIFSDFLDLVEQNQVSNVTISENNIEGSFRDGRKFKTYAPNNFDIVDILRQKEVRITAEPPKATPWYISLMVTWFPMLLLIGVWVFFMRQMQGGGSKALSFGKSRARLLTSNQKKVTFKDVAGVEEAQEELAEIIEFLKDPQKFQKLGGKIPKGVLLVGPPGTGKTLLARAIAGEAEVPFFNISGSDFVEMFVGVGASRVRDLFEQGKKHAPCLIFIDEIDAVGRHRGAGLGGGHDEREQTLNQLLVEMDGFESNEGVILIAATNRPDVLDPALLRPGRFDRQVVVDRPDVRGREGIIKVHINTKVPISEDVDVTVLAKSTPGFSGADLANLVNEAALLAARFNKDKVNMADFENAKDKVLMGVERKSLIITDEEKKNTAYHESGHALVAKLIPNSDPVHKVTIIPRGRALGVTHILPIDERHTYTKEYCNNYILRMLGGRVAEELVFNQISTGSGDDIEKATDLAHRMVCEWGMSDKLGPLTFGKKEEAIFLGKEFSKHKDYSESTALLIDEEVRNIVMENYQKTKHMIQENIDKLHRLAKALLEKEVLDSLAIDEIINQKTPATPPSPAEPPLSATPQMPTVPPPPNEADVKH